ncbi:MAG: hypothetical protein CMQ70_00725 [Gammaproteobacteria bacterium]|nr:hypothetical protein [Gammaproteobacteria bacterium]|tara:strand:+ start:2171 stop:2980 length:810 start_codon:yes stop_codon:yes gene_type:complete
MKIAICIHGLSSGVSSKSKKEVDTIDCFKALKKNLELQNNADFDYFFHSWSHKDNDKIINEIKPKNYFFENHIEFHKNNLLDYLKHLRRKYFFNMDQPKRKNNTISRWYSLKHSIRAMNIYSNENSISYDFVVITRFDAFLLSKYRIQDLDNTNFYASKWKRFYDLNGKEIDEKKINLKNVYKKGLKGFPEDDEGIHDFIFICNQANATKFSNCYDNLNKHFKEVGVSSHKVALNQLIKLDLLDKLNFYNDFVNDINLARWIEPRDNQK